MAILRWILLPLGLVFLAATLLSGCRSGEVDDGHEADLHQGHGDAHDGDAHDEEGVVELSPEAIARVGLVTAPALLQQIVAQHATTGRVGFDERRLAHVSPRVSGRLVRVEAELGDRLLEGEVLAVIDSVELGQARAAYLRTRARQEVAQGRFERERSLLAERITSEQEVLEAEAQAREAKADLAAARETLHLLGLSDGEIKSLSWAESSASLMSLRAPFAGRVVAKEATRGELVSPGRTLFTVANLGEVWVWVDVHERDLRNVRQGETVEMHFDAWPGETFSGKLAYLADEITLASRTLRARVDLPNPARRLKPGMFARVMLTRAGEDGARSVIAVPRTAVQHQGEEAIVFVRTGDTRFERRRVETGQVTDALVEILTGLVAGEDVVTEGAFLLKSQASADQLGGHHH